MRLKEAVTVWRKLSTKPSQTITVKQLRDALTAEKISLVDKRGVSLADKGITLALHKELGKFIAFRISEGDHASIKDKSSGKAWKDARFCGITIPTVIEDADEREAEWD
jgi:hypothetical protein